MLLQSLIFPAFMVVPLLLVARSFSHCVQFIERYYEVYHVAGDKRKAAEISLGVMMAPMTKLARTLAEPSAMLARTLNARGSQEAA